MKLHYHMHSSVQPRAVTEKKRYKSIDKSSYIIKTKREKNVIL